MNSEFNAPDQLARTAVELRGEEGVDWLNRLPGTIADCERRWGLKVDPPFPDLSYNYAAPATRPDGTAVVVKICFPDQEYLAETEALRLYDGRGAVRLLDADVERGVLLLERLLPGTPLATLADDEKETSIAADVMRQLWRPVPPSHPFPSVGDWVARMAERAPDLVRSESRFPSQWIDRGLALFAELDASRVEPVVLHGDLHHGNILAAERQPWLAIDPKGVVGEPACEAGPLLLNELPPLRHAVEWRRILARRVDQLAEELGLDRSRLRRWGVVRAVLSAFWMLEDHGHGWEEAIACAEALAGIANERHAHKTAKARRTPR